MSNKRYLFNCLSDPRRAMRIIPGWWRNQTERNPGDLVYEYAVMNALATDDAVEFIPTGYYHFRGFSDAQIERINATCNAFVCPLANVFSDEFLPLVRRLTDLVKRLRIPCVVPCVGLTATEGAWAGHAPDFDDTVKAFVCAVLDKSAKIGVRGDSTGCYLEKMGFSRDRDFVVVGCPSMYTYGECLPQRALLPPQRLGKCVFSMNQRADEGHWRFIDGLADQFRESTFVSQHWEVFRQFFMTNGWHKSKTVESRPAFKALLLKYASQNRMRFFFNRKPWMDFLATNDVSFGHRIHGALLSVLSGTPTVVVPFESRTEELARFHGIPMVVPSSQGVSSGTSGLRAESIFGNLDFSAPASRQKENFARWISFLHDNGLDTVFDHVGKAKGEVRDFPLETALPTRYPDDDVRSWRFNGPGLKMRMAVAATIASGCRLRGIPGWLKRKTLSLVR